MGQPDSAWAGPASSGAPALPTDDPSTAWAPGEENLARGPASARDPEEPDPRAFVPRPARARDCSPQSRGVREPAGGPSEASPSPEIVSCGSPGTERWRTARRRRSPGERGTASAEPLRSAAAGSG